MCVFGSVCSSVPLHTPAAMIRPTLSLDVVRQDTISLLRRARFVSFLLASCPPSSSSSTSKVGKPESALYTPEQLKGTAQAIPTTIATNTCAVAFAAVKTTPYITRGRLLSDFHDSSRCSALSHWQILVQGLAAVSKLFHLVSSLRNPGEPFTCRAYIIRYLDRTAHT